MRKVPLVLLTRCRAWDSDLMTSIMGPNDVNYGAISLIGVARGTEMTSMPDARCENRCS